MLLCTFGLKDLEKHERPHKKGPKRSSCSGYVSGIIPSSYEEIIMCHYKDPF